MDFQIIPWALRCIEYVLRSEIVRLTLHIWFQNFRYILVAPGWFIWRVECTFIIFTLLHTRMVNFCLHSQSDHCTLSHKACTLPHRACTFTHRVSGQFVYTQTRSGDRKRCGCLWVIDGSWLGGKARSACEGAYGCQIPNKLCAQTIYGRNKRKKTKSHRCPRWWWQIARDIAEVPLTQSPQPLTLSVFTRWLYIPPQRVCVTMQK